MLMRWHSEEDQVILLGSRLDVRQPLAVTSQNDIIGLQEAKIMSLTILQMNSSKQRRTVVKQSKAVCCIKNMFRRVEEVQTYVAANKDCHHEAYQAQR